MRMTKLTLCALLTLSLMIPAMAGADHHEKDKKDKAGEMEMETEMEMEMDTELTGFQEDLLANIQDAEKKLVALAEATPVDKYGWSPSEGVRTTSQVFMHVAGANFFFSRNFGVETPEGIGPGLEEITDKDKVISILKQSFENVYQAVKTASKDDLKKEYSLGTNKFSGRALQMLMATHAHEHLGQAIAYARSSGIVPPWSQGG